MTATVLLRCAGPMQAWGTRSRFTIRDTEREPSKSGVVGLVAAALGRSRQTAVDDLSALYMAVRVDTAGTVEVDYQTALAVARADGGPGGTVLSHRYYLADARFLVALEGDDALCEKIHHALRSPTWPLFLGRKAFVPGEPVGVRDGLTTEGALTALRRVDWPMSGAEPIRELAAVVDCRDDEDGDTRQDVPISFAHDDRRYGLRRVRHITLTPTSTVGMENAHQ